MLDLLTDATGIYWGQGTGPDEFVARVALTDGGDGTLVLEYEAWSRRHGLQHAEAARLGRADGGCCSSPPRTATATRCCSARARPGVFGSVGRRAGWAW